VVSFVPLPPTGQACGPRLSLCPSQVTGLFPLALAASQGDVPMLIMLLESKASVDAVVGAGSVVRTCASGRAITCVRVVCMHARVRARERGCLARSPLEREREREASAIGSSMAALQCGASAWTCGTCAHTRACVFV